MGTTLSRLLFAVIGREVLVASKAREGFDQHGGFHAGRAMRPNARKLPSASAGRALGAMVPQQWRDGDDKRSHPLRSRYPSRRRPVARLRRPVPFTSSARSGG